MNKRRDVVAAEIKAEVMKEERVAKGRFSPELRERIVRHLATRRSQGASFPFVADELGVSWKTLTRWAKTASLPHPKYPVFRRVKIADEHVAPAEPIVLHVGAFRVEGLTVAGVADLVRRLS